MMMKFFKIENNILEASFEMGDLLYFLLLALSQNLATVRPQLT